MTASCHTPAAVPLCLERDPHYIERDRNCNSDAATQGEASKNGGNPRATVKCRTDDGSERSGLSARQFAARAHSRCTEFAGHYRAEAQARLARNARIPAMRAVKPRWLVPESALLISELLPASLAMKPRGNVPATARTAAISGVKPIDAVLRSAPPTPATEVTSDGNDDGYGLRQGRTQRTAGAPA